MTSPKEPHARMTPNDIETYASYVEGIDPARYYDSQVEEVKAAARKRWPLLADVLLPPDPER
ncbi:hypothetical protein [Dyella telluris]|uniref:Uncharacterized protein n=1 Tax=Dyella telluris TaxID=2763498 RepID=A0A7G8Q2C0_9GAMM|nr:hypothetical protein [Dyella telluris]QNK00928.1 hypothetical protein H8F01_17915 [Dyella telluris]